MEFLNIGIDVSKNKHEVCILDHGGRVIKERMRLRNKKASVQKLRTYIDRQTERTKVIPRIALEATGIYFYPIYSQLAPYYEVSVYNPIQTKNRAKGNIRQTKTDKRDAQDLARALIQEEPPKTRYDEKFRFELRELCRYHAKLTDQHTNLMKRYESRVHMLFPLFDSVFDDVHTTTARAIIRKCQTPDEILALGEEKILALVKKASKGHTGDEKVKELLTAAEETITTDISVNATKIELKSMLKVFERLEEEIDNVRKEILAMWSTIAETHYLQTIPGMGAISAAGIWTETGDLEKYDNVDQLTAMAGLDLIVYQTGQRSHKGLRITKHGSKYLRRYLGNIVISCRLHNPAIAKYFKMKLAQGMKFNKTRCAASKKLLRQIWCVERNKKTFVILEE